MAPKAQLYTLNEVIDALFQISKREDSITNLLSEGDFRKVFDSYVLANRTKRDLGDIDTLTDRLVSITHNDEEVYVLDDIQGALSKQQFSQFMQFLLVRGAAVEEDNTTYIPTATVEAFIKNERKLLQVNQETLSYA